MSTATEQQFVLDRLPRTNGELYELVQSLWGIAVPRHKVCPHHDAPFDFFADAFFARSAVSVLHGSRALSGKSLTLALLGMTEAVVLGADVNILGGSGEQSRNVHDAMGSAWNHERAPRWLLASEPTQYETRLTNGAKVKALLASSRSVRGPHPQRLRMDEIDEMDLPILDAALGQPMPDVKRNIQTQVVLSSTLHYPDGPMTEMVKRAADKGWPVFTWCWKDTSNPVDGWLRKGTIDRMRDTVTSEMWRVEFDLGEPSSGNRAIDTDAVEEMFTKELGEYDRKTTGKEMWLPVGRGKPFEEPERKGEYITGVDWAKEQDFSVVAVFRIDVQPWRMVAFGRFHRQPWPVMVNALDKTLEAYGGWCAHDATGIGNVVSDLINYNRRLIKDEVLTGRHRQDLLTDYINGVEKGGLVAPRITSAYTEHLYCVAEGSLVRTLDGAVPIEQVDIGDVVDTSAGPRSVVDVRCNGFRPVFRLRTSDGHELLLTEDHRVATSRGWVEAQRLQVGDMVVVRDTGSAPSRSPRVDAEVLSLVGMPERAVSYLRQRAASDVRRMSDWLQVLGVAAGTDPTEMVKLLALGDWSVPYYPSDAVGETSVDGVTSSVSELVDVLLPYPTPTLDIYFDSVEDVLLRTRQASTSDIAARLASRGVSTDGFSTVGAGVPLVGAPTLPIARLTALGSAGYGGYATVGADAGFRFAHVVECSSLGVQRMVWDIEVSGAHEFYANDVLVHNCTYGDIYEPGKSTNHLPDTVAACALAWSRRAKSVKSSAPVPVGTRASSPWKVG